MPPLAAIEEVNVAAPVNVDVLVTVAVPVTAKLPLTPKLLRTVSELGIVVGPVMVIPEGAEIDMTPPEVMAIVEALDSVNAKEEERDIVDAVEEMAVAPDVVCV